MMGHSPKFNSSVWTVLNIHQIGKHNRRIRLYVCKSSSVWIRLWCMLVHVVHINVYVHSEQVRSFILLTYYYLLFVFFHSLRDELAFIHRESKMNTEQVTWCFIITSVNVDRFFKILPLPDSQAHLQLCKSVKFFHVTWRCVATRPCDWTLVCLSLLTFMHGFTK